MASDRSIEAALEIAKRPLGNEDLLRVSATGRSYLEDYALFRNEFNSLLAVPTAGLQACWAAYCSAEIYPTARDANAVLRKLRRRRARARERQRARTSMRVTRGDRRLALKLLPAAQRELEAAKERDAISLLEGEALRLAMVWRAADNMNRVYKRAGQLAIELPTLSLII